MIDFQKSLALLLEGKILPEAELKHLTQLCTSILLEESNVQPISSPVTICGDVHGQFYDVLELFRKSGELPATKYIFMGDFVDRGYHSVETFSLLMLYKVMYPQHILLLRGNHESRKITEVYGFYDECLTKYGSATVWRLCCQVFDHLALGAIVDGRIMCVHGGLSPDVRTLDQIRTIRRHHEIPHLGTFCDLMWSDPDEIDCWAISPRGAGYLFGSKVTNEFNFVNDLSVICRAHQLVQEGYKFHFPDRNCVTVWSAPNYCYRCGNVASYLKVGEDLRVEDESFGLFNAVPMDQSKIPQQKSSGQYFL